MILSKSCQILTVLIVNEGDIDFGGLNVGATGSLGVSGAGLGVVLANSEVSHSSSQGELSEGESGSSKLTPGHSSSQGELSENQGHLN